MLYAYTEQESQQPTTNRTLKKEKKNVYIILYKACHPLKKKKKEGSWDSFKIK